MMREDILGVAVVKEACPLCASLEDGPIILNKRLTPGEGYGPPRFLVVDIKRQIRLFNELDNKNKQQK